jgi:Asp-tRNA(Asn)/Glu-tRNA(Gln) amidotransferase C subunit
MSIENFKLSIKDFIYFAIYIVTATLFFSSQSNKIDNLTEQISEMKKENKDNSSDNKTIFNDLKNEVKTNSLDIKLLQQDMRMVKDGYFNDK